jgi:hypothetical protein
MKLFTLTFCQKKSLIFVLGYGCGDEFRICRSGIGSSKNTFFRIHVNPEFYPKLILHTKIRKIWKLLRRNVFIFLPVRHEETLLAEAISLLVQLRLACKANLK